MVREGEGGSGPENQIIGEKRGMSNPSRGGNAEMAVLQAAFPWVACPPLQKTLPERAVFAEGRNKMRNRKIPCGDASK